MSSLGTPIASGRTPVIFTWEAGCVLKLIRPGFPPYLADQEYKQSMLAWKLGARAPRPVKLVLVEGRRGVVFPRVDGPDLVQVLERSILRMDSLARLLGRLHAELHRLSTPRFPSLHARLRGNLARATLLDESPRAAILALLDRLPEEAPLCHGDFHLQNILLSNLGPVIIDWEGSMRASPSGDVDNTCLWFHTAFMLGSGLRGWLIRKIGQRLERVYLAEYRRTGPSLAHLSEWMAILAASQMNEENRSKVPELDRIVRLVLPDLHGTPSLT
jgi:aminoglycoside phosphotransferase (APT) family kinase protein